ncbi:MAG: hypothetical protein GPJ54_08250 [Candidatus Heimdallarchaeota archaeon]|nr:hypothetical protein [Candidatus Heimdallarchaeota archaeon]
MLAIFSRITIVVFFLSINILFSTIIPVSSQAPAIPDEDTNSYFGYYWGAAGIASGLLQFSTSEFIEDIVNDQLKLVALEAIDSVWENRYQLENGTKIAAWSKFQDGNIYPSLKYGAAGIASVFIDAFRYTNNQKYLDWASESIDELYLEISNNSINANWPYDYSDHRNTFGIPITDMSFGSLGILQSTLELYDMTGDSRHLEQAFDAYTWLESVAETYTINGLTTKLLPWYIQENYTGPLYSSFYSGNAAAIPIFIELGQIINNQTITEWAHDIANVYIQIQKEDGSWPIIINKPNSLSRTTIELGSAGIIQSLSTLSQAQFPNIVDTLENGVSWLVSQINRTEGRFFIPPDPNYASGKYSMFNGLTGILKSIRRTNQSQFDDTLIEGYNYLLQNIIYNKTLNNKVVAGFYPSSSLEPYTDLSLMDGLIGVGLELLDVIKSGRGLIDIEITEMTILHIINTYLKFQNQEGIWPKQITILSPVIENINDDNNVFSKWWIWLLAGLPIIIYSFVKQYYSKKKS